MNLDTNPTTPKIHREHWLEFVQTLNPQIDFRALRLMDQLRQVSHSILRISEVSLADAGLSFAKYRILISLMISEEVEERSDLNPSEISFRQGTSRNTISSLIRDLENEGFIERNLDVHDKRKFNIRLTKAGRDIVEIHAGNHLAIIADIFSCFSEEDLELLSGLLDTLGRNAAAKEKVIGSPSLKQ
jgi:DNA-binding MarR family transcriptional regulator